MTFHELFYIFLPRAINKETPGSFLHISPMCERRELDSVNSIPFKDQ